MALVLAVYGAAVALAAGIVLYFILRFEGNWRKKKDEKDSVIEKVENL